MSIFTNYKIALIGDNSTMRMFLVNNKLLNRLNETIKNNRYLIITIGDPGYEYDLIPFTKSNLFIIDDKDKIHEYIRHGVVSIIKGKYFDKYRHDNEIHDTFDLRQSEFDEFIDYVNNLLDENNKN
jgi:DNA-binding transcriptional regulator LsrR (DeoR family)